MKFNFIIVINIFNLFLMFFKKSLSSLFMHFSYGGFLDFQDEPV